MLYEASKDAGSNLIHPEIETAVSNSDVAEKLSHLQVVGGLDSIAHHGTHSGC